LRSGGFAILHKIHFSIICDITVAADGNGFAAVGGLRLKVAEGKILDPRQDLPDLAATLTGVAAVVRRYTVGLQAKGVGDLQGSVQVVFLGDDNDLFDSENGL